MAGDLDQLGRLDGLAAAGLDRERQDRCFLRSGWVMAETLNQKVISKNENLHRIHS